MIVAAAEKIRKFFDGFACNVTPLLLLDYDGTLAPFRVDRFRAKPWAGVREILTRIQRQGRSRIAIITGRPAHEIGPLLNVDPPFEVWGLHGAERLFPNGRSVLQPAPSSAREKLDLLRALLKHDSFGGIFEDKANGAVMHWRGASPHKARLIEERARALFEPLAGNDGLNLLNFEAGVELRVGRDKGGAVETILSETNVDAPVAYLGDDCTDEAAFRAVNKVGTLSLSVLVRNQWHETAADLWLRPPSELREFMEDWFRVLERC